MRTLKLIEHISLDGVVQVSGEGGFPYGDWTAPFRSPADRDAMVGAHGERFDLLLGRRTYDGWSAYWPKVPRNPMANSVNAATKYVVTHRPDPLPWGPAEWVGTDIVEGVRRIKALEGPTIVMSGSTTLVSTVLEHGLADEILLAVYPVLLGRGKRFALEGTPARSFRLVGTTAFPSGIVLTTYQPGEPLPANTPL
jgi:dihydrofolate reductase